MSSKSATPRITYLPAILWNPDMKMVRLVSFALALAGVPVVQAQTASEARAAHAYDVAVKGGPLTLNAFLDQFPKGADLHVHLSGAVYAETFIRDAAEDGLCVDPKALAF